MTLSSRRRRSPHRLKLATIFVGTMSAFLLNFAWEAFQAPFFQGARGLAQDIHGLALTAAAYAGLVALLYLIVAINRLDAVWIKTLGASEIVMTSIGGFVVGVLIEHWGVDYGVWGYVDIPLIPIFELGLPPVAQLAVIAPVVFVLMHQTESGRRRDDVNGL